jgi:hypothetical protein
MKKKNMFKGFGKLPLYTDEVGINIIGQMMKSGKIPRIFITVKRGKKVFQTEITYDFLSEGEFLKEIVDKSK